jgi:PhnB protein
VDGVHKAVFVRGEKVMQVNPYLFFEGRCEEAIQFYQATVGARVEMLMRFKDAPPSPDQSCMMAPGSEENVMHAALKIGEATVMVSDGQASGQSSFSGFSLSLMADSRAEAERAFNALGEGGQVVMPLGDTFFAKQFGMVKDKFGVSWMVLFMG